MVESVAKLGWVGIFCERADEVVVYLRRSPPLADWYKISGRNKVNPFSSSIPSFIQSSSTADFIANLVASLLTLDSRFGQESSL